jgi:hypothetical protein
MAEKEKDWGTAESNARNNAGQQKRYAFPA